jgi:perosamine synthetase
MSIREIPFARPWITAEDRAAVLRVLDGHILTHGPECQDFESEFAAALGPQAHAVTMSSCMAALHAAWLHFRIGPGDEIITPALTHTATAHAIEWTGATPVFVDCDPSTGNVTPAAIERALTPRTRGIAVVHFVGIPCDMPAIMELAERRNLIVVEDCALAVGSRWNGRHVGLFGHAGCFSFYPAKHITTAEGGMLVTKDRVTAKAIARLRAFGVDRRHDERALPGMYDVPELGLNFRMSEIQAALGRAQLVRLGENLALRARNFAHLKSELQALPGVSLLDSSDAHARNSHYCLTVVLDEDLGARRSELMLALKAAGIGTSIYYPHPVPRLQYYQRKYGWNPSSFPHATAISDRSIALPVGWHLQPEDLDYLVKTMRRCVSEVMVCAT